MTLHNLQIKKFTLMFNNFDYNKDGFVERADHNAVVDRACTLRGLTAGTAEYEELHGRLSGIWDMFEQNVDSDGDGKVTLDEWLAFYELMIQAPEDQFMGVIVGGVSSMIDMADADGDGALSAEEYKLYLDIFGADSSQSDSYFAKLDEDGDGKINRDEMLKHLQDWYRSTDISVAGNYLAGPI